MIAKRHQHAKKVKSTQFYAPWKIIVQESYSTRKEAVKRECYLKSLKNKNYLLTIVVQTK